jgi:hypothetical protein
MGEAVEVPCPEAFHRTSLSVSKLKVLSRKRAESSAIIVIDFYQNEDYCERFAYQNGVLGRLHSHFLLPERRQVVYGCMKKL